jgi:hypothetical protein
MVDLTAWASVDLLSFNQAARLWSGVNPSLPDSAVPHSQRLAIIPNLQMLMVAVLDGKLVAELSEKPGDSLVRRAELIRFAESTGQKPDFLFLTMDIGHTPTNRSPTIESPADMPKITLPRSQRAKRRSVHNEIDDSALVARMKKALDAKEASSPNNAALIEARKLTNQTSGKAVEAVQRRLKGKFQKTFPNG